MQFSTELLVWRKFSGPFADEIHLRCSPDTTSHPNIARQASSVFGAIEALLSREGGSLAHVVNQIIFFRDIARDFNQFEAAYRSLFSADHPECRPAATFIEQPPLDTSADLVVSATAIIPRGCTIENHGFSAPAAGRSCTLGDQKILFSGNIAGTPGGIFDQTCTMFSQAGEVLAREGMNFRDVIRTWIYLRHMDRDYGEFNRARREFFRRSGVTLLPASTGISGSPLREDADLLLSFCAVKSPRPLEASAMTAPTLNEASIYGSDFSRGLRVVEKNKIGLHVSGTASVDEQGRTAHVGEFGAQAERMLLNIETLLSEQGASFADALSAITYVKNAADAPKLDEILRTRGLDKLPNAIVHAAVCRPDLLCEMELIAASSPAPAT